MIATGATAHLPPIYPLILSLIYRIFGLTSTAGYASLLFIIINGSVLMGVLPWFSEKLGFSKQAGIIGALGGAIFMEMAGHGEYLTALVMGLLLIAFLGRWTKNNNTPISTLLLGVLMGISFHLQPALLPVMLGCIIFELWWSQNPKKWALTGLMSHGDLRQLPGDRRRHKQRHPRRGDHRFGRQPAHYQWGCRYGRVRGLAAVMAAAGVLVGGKQGKHVDK